MKSKRSFRFYITLIGLIMLLTVNPIYGQGQTTDATKGQTTDTKGGSSQNKEPLFKLESFIIESVKGKIPDEKFSQIEKLKDQEFSEKQLPVTLTGLGFETGETETVMNYIREYLNFTDKIRKTAPVILSIDTAKSDIQKKEAELESVQSDDQKKKLSDELKELRPQLKKLEQDFKNITGEGIDRNKLEQVTVILKELYNGEDIQKIADYLLEQAQFTKMIETLETILQSINAVKEDIRKKEAEEEKAPSKEEKAKIAEEVKELSERLKKLENDFSVITSKVDIETFFKKEGKEVDWEKELKEIFSPIIVELKESTERPRKMEQLRGELLFYEKRIPQLKEAYENVRNFSKNVTNPNVKKRLDESAEFWKQQEKEFITKKETAEHQLIEEERARKSLWKSFKVFFDSFVKHRGKNLFFAVLAFFAIYLLFRFLQRLIWKFSPVHRSSKYMFWANLIDVLFMILTFLAAGSALIVVLYTSGDWLILGIVILIILGIIWGARNTIPAFSEQIKLMLGFGTVRQGETLIFEGIPYRVEMLGVYSYLKNPLLTGGTIRLPLKDLIEMRSIPNDENPNDKSPNDEREEWFPCKEGDWLLINENKFVQILLQTPLFVKIHYVSLNMDAVIPVKTFMNQTIVNLSAGPSFHVDMNLNVSPKHLVTVLDESFAGKLEKLITEEIKSKPYGEHLVRSIVEVAAITDTSSIKILMRIEMKKEAASKWSSINRHFSRIALKAANKYGLDFIPVTHVNLHKSDGLLENNEV